MKKNLCILIATLSVFFSGHTLADNNTDLFNEYKIGSSLEKNTHDLKNTDEQNINIKSHIRDSTGNTYDNYVFPGKNNIKRKINVFCMESDINSISLSVLDLDKSI